MAILIIITYGDRLDAAHMDRRGVVSQGTMPAPPVMGYFNPEKMPQLQDMIAAANKRFAEQMSYCAGGSIPA